MVLSVSLTQHMHNAFCLAQKPSCKNKKTSGQNRVFCKSGQRMAECKNKLLSGWPFFYLALRTKLLEKWVCSHLGKSPLHSWVEQTRLISAPSHPTQILNLRRVTKGGGGSKPDWQIGLSPRLLQKVEWKIMRSLKVFGIETIFEHNGRVNCFV